MPFKIVRNDITRVRPFGTAHILKASCIFKWQGEGCFKADSRKPEGRNLCIYKWRVD